MSWVTRSRLLFLWLVLASAVGCRAGPPGQRVDGGRPVALFEAIQPGDFLDYEMSTTGVKLPSYLPRPPPYAALTADLQLRVRLQAIERHGDELTVAVIGAGAVDGGSMPEWLEKGVRFTLRADPVDGKPQPRRVLLPWVELGTTLRTELDGAPLDCELSIHESGEFHFLNKQCLSQSPSLALGGGTVLYRGVWSDEWTVVEARLLSAGRAEVVIPVAVIDPDTWWVEEVDSSSVVGARLRSSEGLLQRTRFAFDGGSPRATGTQILSPVSFVLDLLGDPTFGWPAAGAVKEQPVHLGALQVAVREDSENWLNRRITVWFPTDRQPLAGAAPQVQFGILWKHNAPVDQPTPKQTHSRRLLRFGSGGDPR